MDQADIDPLLHDAALASLSRLNAWARSARIVWPAIRAVAHRSPDSACRVLDVATGAGDVPLALYELAASAGLELECTGLDISRHALAHAHRRADAAGESLTLRRCDVLNDEWPSGEYDVVMCSLFLHHLAEEQAVALLARMHATARRLVVVSDLRRSARGLLLTQIASHVLTRSPVVRVDGPRSVRAAFTLAEASGLAKQAGWGHFEARSVWPFRLVLTCRKDKS